MRAKELRQGVLIGVLLLAAFWLVSLIWGLAGKAQIAITQAAAAQRQYAALEKRKTELAASVQTLLTPRGQSAAIRTAFGVARPGEEVIVVVPPASTTPTVVPPWWVRMWRWL